jgi:hypothetical protein
VFRPAYNLERGNRMRMPNARMATTRLGHGLFVAAVMTLVGVVISPPAWAGGRPSVSWSLPSQATAGAATPISYTSTLSHGSHLAVQRPVGTAKVWRTVLALPGRSGSADLPPVALGAHPLRLAEIRGGRVLAEQRKTLKVFGHVPFATLFPSGSRGSYATPTASFGYALVENWTNGDHGLGAISVTHSTCRLVHIEFVAGTGVSFPLPAIDYVGDMGTLTVVQEREDPVSAVVPFDGASTLETPVGVGESWSVNVSNTPESEGITFYLNGFADCYSTASLEGS